MTRWVRADWIGFEDGTVSVTTHDTSFHRCRITSMVGSDGQKVKNPEDAGCIEAVYDTGRLCIMLSRQKKRRRWWHRMNGFKPDESIYVTVGHT